MRKRENALQSETKTKTFSRFSCQKKRKLFFSNSAKTRKRRKRFRGFRPQKGKLVAFFLESRVNKNKKTIKKKTKTGKRKRFRGFRGRPRKFSLMQCKNLKIKGLPTGMPTCCRLYQLLKGVPLSRFSTRISLKTSETTKSGSQMMNLTTKIMSDEKKRHLKLSVLLRIR